jgi:hypothetical protein
MIFDKVQFLLRIRILHKVSDPYVSGFGSGSTTLTRTISKQVPVPVLKILTYP